MAYKVLTKEELKDYAPRSALKALERKLAARIKALEENQAQPAEPAALPVDGE